MRRCSIVSTGDHQFYGSAQEFHEAPNWRGFQDSGFPRAVGVLATATCRLRSAQRGVEAEGLLTLKLSFSGYGWRCGQAGNPSFYEGVSAGAKIPI